jgi:hypothetical protein
MWKLYLSGAEGVAIKTTVSSLVQLFSIWKELKIGRVAYRDVDDIECSPEVFAFQDGHDKGEAELLPFEAPIFRKNRGYAHAAFAQSRPVTIETSILLDKPQIGKHQVVGNAP